MYKKWNWISSFWIKSFITKLIVKWI